MTYGEFGKARVKFAAPDQRIPADLLTEFELLRVFDREPDRAWIERLERFLARAARPPAWSILRVSPGLERRVRDALRDAGLMVYAPMERYRPRGRIHARVRSLMPGYIFALITTEAELDLARDNQAVREVMCRQTPKGPRPLTVASQVIGEMVFLEACRAFDTAKATRPVRSKRSQRSAPQRNWKKGQMVKIADGPVAGFVGEVLRADRADRIRLMVEMFGRATEIELDEAMLDGWDD